MGPGEGAGVGLNECPDEHGPWGLGTQSPPRRMCAHVPCGSWHTGAFGVHVGVPQWE